MRSGASLITAGQIILSGYVMSDTSAGWAWGDEVYFCPQMVREALSAHGDGDVTIRINSNGGDPVAGEAIRSILREHAGTVTMIVEGCAASAASLLLMGAGRREMTAGSWIMIHNPSAYVFGSAEDLRAEADFLDKLAAMYARVYADASGQDAPSVLAMMEAETFMSADEAIGAGLVHAVHEPAATSTQPVEITARDEVRTAMRASLTTFAALMRSKVPAAAPDAVSRLTSAATGGAPALPALTMEASLPNPNPTPGATPATPPALPTDVQSQIQMAVQADRQRQSDLRMMAAPFIAAGRLTDADVQTAIDDGTTAEAAGSRFMATMAAREPIGTNAAPIQRGRDETETRRMAMEDALVMRLSSARVEDPTRMAAARQFDTFNLVDLAAERLEMRRVPNNFAAREDAVRMAFHSTSDFPALFENALNRSLAARYAQALPTYRRIARQRSYQDFREHTTVRMGDFPDFKEVSPEAGEIKAGTFGESKEKTAVKAYGVQVLLSRQMLVNDTLSGLQQVLNDRGAAVARFEDRTFYAMFLSGANADGPTLLETTRQVFNTTDATKAGTAAAINVSSLSAGRAALRKQKSKDGSELEIAAAILLVGPDKETEAQQLLAPIQAQQAGNVNPFSGTLSLAVTAKITGNGWYMFASPDEVPCFEWGLLDGYAAPRFRMEDPFGVQGTKMSLEHDFGCGAIDCRGGYKNAGA